MSDASFRDLHRTGAEFLLADLDTALTFMDVAEVSRNEETVRRNHQNAHRALETVLHLREKLVLEKVQEQAFNEKVTLLKARLQAVGFPL